MSSYSVHPLQFFFSIPVKNTLMFSHDTCAPDGKFIEFKFKKAWLWEPTSINHLLLEIYLTNKVQRNLWHYFCNPSNHKVTNFSKIFRSDWVHKDKSITLRDWYQRISSLIRLLDNSNDIRKYLSALFESTMTTWIRLIKLFAWEICTAWSPSHLWSGRRVGQCLAWHHGGQAGH